jgi:hypothetical protein
MNGFNMSLMWRFQAFKFSFDVDILGHFFQKLGKFFFQFSVACTINMITIVIDASSGVNYDRSRFTIL